MRDDPKRSFEALYERTSRRLLVYLARRMQDPDAATELWSECWAVAFEGWPRCRARTRGEAEAWLFGLARNQLAGYYRTGAVQQRALERLKWSVPQLDSEELDELERNVELSELRSVLGEALGGLPEKRRVAVQLRVVAGLSYADVAARMRCSEQAARAHVSRGLRSLAEALRDDELPAYERGAV